MHIRTFDSIADFLGYTALFLERREVENNLLLGVLGHLRQTPPATPPLLCAVEDGSAVIGAAVHQAPHKLLLTDMPPLAVASLADALARRRFEFPGALGPGPATELFARAWRKLSGRSVAAPRVLFLYQADRIAAPRPAPGRFREAIAGEAELLLPWIASFLDEVQDRTMKAEPRLVQTLIAEGRLFVWEDGPVVSMAAWSGGALRYARVNFVYTPPGRRGRSYASNCVAALSRRLLESGKTGCCLFTHADNPTPNAIYRRLGYEPVGSFREYWFQ